MTAMPTHPAYGAAAVSDAALAGAERVFATAIRDFIAEFCLLDGSVLIGWVRSGFHGNIADLVASSAEPFFKESTLSYADGADVRLDWGRSVTVMLDMEFVTEAVTVFFKLVLDGYYVGGRDPGHPRRRPAGPRPRPVRGRPGPRPARPAAVAAPRRRREPPRQPRASPRRQDARDEAPEGRRTAWGGRRAGRHPRRRGARQDSLDGVALGLRLEAAGDRAGAEALYRRAAARDPQNAFAHHLVGRCLHAAGRSAEAAEALARAVALRPRDPGMRADLGDALLAAGRRDEAAAAYRRVAKLDPSHPAAARAALGLAAVDPPARAAASLRRLIAAQPGTPERISNSAASSTPSARPRPGRRSTATPCGPGCSARPAVRARDRPVPGRREREGAAAVALAAELARTTPAC